MTTKELIELLSKLREKMPRNCCYGIRLNRKGEVIIFYHPYGCEGEWSCKPEELDALFKRIQECSMNA